MTKLSKFLLVLLIIITIALIILGDRLIFKTHLDSQSCLSSSPIPITDRNSSCNYEVIKNIKGEISLFMKNSIKTEPSQSLSVALSLPMLYQPLLLPIKLSKNINVCDYPKTAEKNILFRCYLSDSQQLRNEIVNKRTLIKIPRNENRCNEKFVDIFSQAKGYMSLLLFKSNKCDLEISQIFYL